ncbi:major histocompatibility complex class I-related gene protein isoform X1 [Xenopus laevis]|uniref:Major histocompatibility complex class I-related gene protein isoform X1 n=2 Tax=Xenopus laevis TaxID=8355 RepID=A0A8J1LJ07_XENLA|nr:major histocompatibility complex class I-related gene protein isoform X1 [Xenopus laevis]
MGHTVLLLLLLLLLSLGVCAVHCAGGHVFQYLITRILFPTPGLPMYSIILYLDDLKCGKYSSDTRQAQVLISLDGLINILPQKVLAVHLEMQTKFAQELEITERDEMEFIMGFSNKTYDKGQFHVYQRKFVCELNEDGTTSGYEEIALNGKEIIALDKEKVVYVPVMQEALVMMDQLNKRYDHAVDNKMYMENECIQQIKLYLYYLSADLNRKVSPKVKVSSSESESGTKLHCWAYGFYPRDVEVKWIKNGRDEIYSEESAEILPNPDGTYQIRVSVEVTPEEGATYSCHVDHSSLEDRLVVPFESSNRSMLYLLIGGTALLLVLASFALGIFIYTRRKSKGLEKTGETA